MKIFYTILRYAGVIGCGMGVAAMFEYGLCLDAALLVLLGLVLAVTTKYAKWEYEKYNGEYEEEAGE